MKIIEKEQTENGLDEETRVALENLDNDYVPTVIPNISDNDFWDRNRNINTPI